VSAGAQGAAMTKPPGANDVEALLREIQRYLAYVEAFRRDERREPPAEQQGGKET